MTDKHLNKPPPIKPEKNMNDHTLNVILKVAALVALILLIIYLANK